MLNRIQRLILAASGVAGCLIVLDINPAQAYSFSFTQEFETGETLTGEFFGEDSNGNGQLDASEFLSFTSAFVGGDAGFENLTWGLTNLASFSYFVAPGNYNFFVTAPTPGNSNGWRSNTLLGDTVVGFAPSAGVVNGRFFAQEPLSFARTEAIPEPTTMTGLALGGLGLAYARRRKQRQSGTANR